MRTAIIVSLALIAPLPAAAQATDDDGEGFLTELIEDQLSDVTRSVNIEGFDGALSSRATIRRLTISDGEGIWLEAEGLLLDWNRGALFSGRLEIAELSAERISLPRAPVADPDIDLPSPEATPFSLPELPVSINIEALNAERIEIGAALVGEDLVAQLDANATLAGGAGSAKLLLERTDGLRGRFDIDASYDNASKVLNLATVMEEAAGGLVPRSLGLPGAPSVRLDLSGSGPLTGFDGALNIATDGAERITGSFATEQDDGQTAYSLDISGDVAAMLAPEYQAFFGDDLRLQARAQQAEDGSVTLNALDLAARQVRLSGAAAFDPDGWPSRLALEGRIAADSGPVLLPIAGAATEVDSVDLSVTFNAAAGDEWQGTFDVTGLNGADYALPSVRLDGGGLVQPGTGSAVGQITADLSYAATGLRLTDAKLDAAVPSDISGELSIVRVEDAPLNLPLLTVLGEDLSLTATAQLDGGSLAATVLAEAQDLTRFSLISGLPLGGAASIQISGSAVPLDGSVDLLLTAETDDLRVGEALIDPLLAGSGRVAMAIVRDGTGVTLDGLTATTDLARITGDARLTTDVSAGQVTARIEDMAVLVPRLSGEAEVKFDGARAVAEDGSSTARVRADLQLPTGTATADIRQDAAGTFTGDIAADLARLDAYSDLVGRALQGAARFTASGRFDPATGDSDVTLSGTTDDLGVGDPGLDRLLSGPGQIDLTAAGRIDDTPGAEDVVRAEVALSLPQTAITADLARDGQALGGQVTGDLEDLSRLSALAGRALSGSASFDGTGRYTPGTGAVSVDIAAQSNDLKTGDADIDAVLRGAGRYDIDLAGTIDATPGAEDLERAVIELDLPSARITADVARMGEALTGSLAAQLRGLSSFGGLAGRDLSGSADVNLTGAFTPVTGAFAGQVTGGTTDLGLGLGALDRLTAGIGQVSGTLSGDGNGGYEATDLQVVLPNLRLALDGQTDGATGRARYDARLRDVGLFTDALSGPLSAVGTASQSTAGRWQVDTDVTGPGGAALAISGTVAEQLGLGITGTLPLALLNTVLEPRRLSGGAQLNLSVNGPPALSSVSGTIEIAEARLAAPNLGQTLEAIVGRLTLAGGQATLGFSGQVPSGGSVTLSGPIGLTGGLSADLSIALDRVSLRDPQLYETAVSGRLSVQGPLTGGAAVSGALQLGVTEIRVPTSSVSSLGDLPEVTHIGAPRAVVETLSRAGTTVSGRDAAASGSGTARPYPLDISVAAPSRIFVRGRGLDAELGGQLRLSGTTANVIPSGQFNLVRGRLDILQQRFDLTEGSARLEGAFVPTLRLVARTETDDGTVVEVIVEGPADTPEITFSSSPELPQDEVLARLLFGRSVSEMSPLQAIQLAAAIRTLAGRGGNGLASQFREGLDLDNLDITTDDEGNAAVRAGKYISENIYTEVTVDSAGETSIDLNIDLTDSLTARGSVGADGETSVGIFFERDY